MGETSPGTWRWVGDRAILREFPGRDLARRNESARLLYARIRELRLAEVEDVVPAAASLLVLLRGLAGSVLLQVAEELGLASAGEGFADRRYTPDGSLAPRTLAEAVIVDPEEAAEQALRIARDHEVVAVDGTRVGIRAETLCIHGDTRGAPAIARAVRGRLLSAGIEIRAL